MPPGNVSLLDDPQGLAGLDRLEPFQPRGTLDSDPLFLAGVDDLDRGLIDLPPVPGEAATPRIPLRRPVFPDDPAELTPDDWTILLKSHAGVWMFCGLIGAAAAALVFQDPVSRLIAQWTGVARPF